MKKMLLFLCLCITVMANSSFASDYSAAKDFVANGFILKKGAMETRDGIIRKLGQPAKITKEGPDRRSGETYMCTIYYMDYEGLKLTVSEGKQCSRKGLQYISITSNKYKVKHNIGVGASKEQVLRVLGKPVYAKGNEIYYTYDREDEDLVGDHVDFYFDASNQVSKIDWSDH